MCILACKIRFLYIYGHGISMFLIYVLIFFTFAWIHGQLIITCNLVFYYNKRLKLYSNIRSFQIPRSFKMCSRLIFIIFHKERHPGKQIEVFLPQQDSLLSIELGFFSLIGWFAPEYMDLKVFQMIMRYVINGEWYDTKQEVIYEIRTRSSSSGGWGKGSRCQAALLIIGHWEMSRLFVLYHYDSERYILQTFWTTHCSCC